MWKLDNKKGWEPKNWCLQTVVLEKTLESPLACKETNQSILKEINPEYGLMLKFKLQFLATWCKELTYWKSPWCWKRLKAGREGDDREWVGWIASPTQWIWVWVGSGSWWWTGKPGVLWFMGSDMTKWLKWTELNDSTSEVFVKFLSSE